MIGALAAGVDLPELPPDCDKQYQHAPVRVGGDSVVTLRLERDIVDAANGTIKLCADNYRTVRKNYAKKASATGQVPRSISK